MAKKTYHHGNLRQALVEASLDVLAQNGAGGFSLAHAAK
ncbi:MAG: TetR/AcrR family transcriptional regulator, partial [Pseudomonadota bacterium]